MPYADVTLEVLVAATGEWVRADTAALRGKPRRVHVPQLGGSVITLAAGERFRLRLASRAAVRLGVVLKVDGVQTIRFAHCLDPMGTQIVDAFQDCVTDALTYFTLHDAPVDSDNESGISAAAFDASRGTIDWRVYTLESYNEDQTIVISNPAVPAASSSKGKGALLNGLATVAPAFSQSTKSMTGSSWTRCASLVESGRMCFRDRCAILLLLGDAAAVAGAGAAAPRRKRRAADAIVIEDSDSESDGGRKTRSAAAAQAKAALAALVAAGARCPWTFKALRGQQVVHTTCGHFISEEGWGDLQKSARAGRCASCKAGGVAAVHKLLA